MYDYTVDRPEKRYCRHLFFSQVDKPAKTYLCLPSAKAEDVKQALEMGAINKNTQVWAFEEDFNVWDKSNHVIYDMGFRKEPYILNQKVETFFNLPQIDLAYVDPCGPISANFAIWAQSVNWAPNAKIAFTFNSVKRGPKTPDSFPEQVMSGQYKLREDAKFTAGYHEDPMNPKIEHLCEVFSFLIPGIKWNITTTYRDTRFPMLFFGGYLGKSGKVQRPVVKNPQISYVDRFIERLLEVQTGYHTPQKFAHVKIGWNRLTEKEKRQVRRHYLPELRAVL